jgi:V/A-type H+/Na+-transporting ATPase subunit E
MKQETGKDKIQKICDALRKETLEPAKREGREIVENAHMQAQAITAEAQNKANRLLEETQKEIEEKKKVFAASLQLACRQGIELLKQRIEKDLFDHELGNTIHKSMSDPNLVASLLSSFMQAMREKGIEEDFVALIPKHISPRSINEMLASKVLERLHGGSVAVGDFEGGVQIRLKDSHITVDISDQVVRDLIARYIRRDFRDLVFNV